MFEAFARRLEVSLTEPQRLCMPKNRTGPLRFNGLRLQAATPVTFDHPAFESLVLIHTGTPHGREWITFDDGTAGEVPGEHEVGDRFDFQRQLRRLVIADDD